MAIGGFLGSALAGLTGYDRAQQEAQQNQYRQLQMRLQQQEYQQRLQQQQQEQAGLNAAFGTLQGLGGLGGAPPLQQMPQTTMPQMGDGGPPDQLIPPQRTQSGQDMGGGMAAGGAATRSGYDLPALLRLASQAGFSPEAAPKMAAISMAESSGNPGAINRKDPGGSYGLTQINAKAHGDQYAKAALDPNVAMKEAFDISKGGTDFSPWSTYKSGAYKQFLEKTLQGGQALAQQVGQDIDPRVQGRAGLAQLAAAVEKAAPNADGATKMLAVMHLEKLLAPYDKLQFQQYMKENQNEFRAELQRHQQEFQDKERQEREKFQAGQKDKSGSGFEAFRDPSGNLHYIKKGENIPEGFQRDNKRYVGAQGMALQTFIDEYRQEHDGKMPSSQDIRGWQTSNAMATAEGRTVGGRTAMLETAANAAEAMGPLLIEASEKINRTEYPDINKIILAYEEKTGSPEVVQYGEMLNTMRYLYARALSPTGQARVADLQNFDKIMTAAWTKGQIKAGIDQINKSLGVERQAIQKTKEGVMNQPGVTAPKGAPASGAAKYSVGQIIDTPKGKMRVTGGDLNGDPDIEPVK